MNKKFFLGALALVMLAGCGNANTGVDEEGAAASDAPATADAKTTSAEIEQDGATTKAEVTKEGDKVTAVSIDVIDEEGLSKKDLGDDYSMKADSSIEKEWYEQVEFLENYILENGVDSIKMTDDGKAENEDLKSGCTISIKTMVDAVKEAEAK